MKYRQDLLQLFSSFATHSEALQHLMDKYDISKTLAENIIKENGVTFPTQNKVRSSELQDLSIRE